MAFYYLIERGKEKHKQDNQWEDFPYLLRSDISPGLFVELPFEPNVYYGCHPSKGKFTVSEDGSDDEIVITYKEGIIRARYKKFIQEKNYTIWKKSDE